MRLEWSRRSLRELAAIEAYIAERNPAAAHRVLISIVESAEHLRTFPHMGRRSEQTSVRLLKVAAYPYIMPYRVRDDAVEILAVLHTRMDRPEEWK